MHSLGRRAVHLRPSMHVTRSWPFAEAEALDDRGLLVGEIHEAINRVLAVLEETPVQMVSRTGQRRALRHRTAKPRRRRKRSAKKPRKRTRATKQKPAGRAVAGG